MGTMGSLPEDSQQNAGNTANLTEVSLLVLSFLFLQN